MFTVAFGSGTGYKARMEPNDKPYAVLARKPDSSIITLDVDTYHRDYEPLGYEIVGRVMLTDEERAAGEVIFEIKT